MCRHAESGVDVTLVQEKRSVCCEKTEAELMFSFIYTRFCTSFRASRVVCGGTYGHLKSTVKY